MFALRVDCNPYDLLIFMLDLQDSGQSAVYFHKRTRNNYNASNEDMYVNGEFRKRPFPDP